MNSPFRVFLAQFEVRISGTSIESSEGKSLTVAIRLPYIDKHVRMLEAGSTKSDNK
jgi:hypothetical protein